MLQVQSIRRCLVTILINPPTFKRSFFLTRLTRSQATNRNQGSSNKISSYLHRIGYHFLSGIFDEACNELGYRFQGGKLVRESDEAISSFDRVMARYGAQFDNLPNRNPMADEETRVKKAIKELFPRIPDSALKIIFQTAWREVRAFRFAQRIH